MISIYQAKSHFNGNTDNKPLLLLLLLLLLLEQNVYLTTRSVLHSSEMFSYPPAFISHFGHLLLAPVIKHRAVI